MTALIETIQQAIISGDPSGAKAQTEQALVDGITAQELINQAVIPAMAEVGLLFERGEYYLPEMMISALATKQIMGLIRPLLAESGVQPVARVVLGTVQGDMHDIGKNIVSMMLEGAGFSVIDIGVDVPPEAFVTAIKDSGAEIVGISALLTTTMTGIPVIIRAIKEAGLRDQVKILVGGAPITAEFAAEVGADGFAPDASSATRKAKELLGLA
jgi:5-methyltetrahydrofolate--homocysteine methyltransferase